MNIASSNILSMLSSAEGSDTTQQLLASDGAAALEFSDQMLKKMQQLKGGDKAVEDLNNLVREHLSSDKQLHEFTGLSQIDKAISDLSNFVGKGLPQQTALDKDINLENTLETLSNIVNTLNEGSKETLDSYDQINSAIEQIEAIKQEIPEQVEAIDQLDSVAKQLKNLALSHANEADKIKHLDTMEESVKQVKSLLNNAPNIISDPISINEDVNKSELDNKIGLLSDELQSIKKIVSQNTTATGDEQTEEINIQDDSEPVGIEGEMASLLASIREPKELDKAGIIPVYHDAKPIQNKESLSIKQILEQQNQGIAAKPESVDDLIQTVQPEAKVAQDNVDSLLINRQLQNQQTNIIESKEPELSTERALPKFATDIANLNRAVMAENKAEIPPMTKHFANPEWNKEIGERVIWMHKQAIPSAQLRLNPGHLGPVTIKIDVTQDQASVAFTAQHAAVKEAIDAALPKLREMFSTQQLNLAEVSVSQEDAGQKQQRSFSQMGSDTGKGGNQENEILENEHLEITMDIAEEIEAGRAIASNGVLSLFA